MRMIGSVDTEDQARKISAYLESQGIENTIDSSFDPATGYFSRSVWIHNEDKIAVAREIFEDFKRDATNAIYNTAASIPMRESDDGIVIEEINRPTHATFFFLALCAFVFLLNLMQSFSLNQEGVSENPITPVQVELLYDVPPVLEQLEGVIEKYNISPTQKIEELPPEVKNEIKVLETTPYWRGIYDLILLKMEKKDASLAKGPLFAKIRQGEVWRLFSPCVLHTQLLHILFNMLWLWMLGRQIEQRIGAFRYILLTLLTGVGSNFAQYLIGGPFFLGYSGVIMGLAGFIWMREKIAPWEGYPLQRSIVIFLAVYVLAMFGLQFSSFLFALFSNIDFTPNIANTAHIAGAILGALLARLTYFEARPS